MKNEPILNEEQKKAASFTNGVASVIAVPGAGKTMTMTYRIANLVKNHGVVPENVLCLTFTRNAAAAMKTKLKLILKEAASRVSLLTIHSFCYGILKNEGKVFEILTDKDQLIIIKKIMKKAKINSIPAGMVIREIGLAKNNLISASDFIDLYEGDHTMLKIGHVFSEYEMEKKKKLLIDLNDLLWETYHLLKDNKEIRKQYQTRYQHVLIDEFQDVNILQISLLKLLVEGRNNGNGHNASFWVCGDDWQSIYGFTGAQVTNILNFKQVFPGSKQFVLETNYRSTPEILDVCQKLIGHNQDKIEKTLRTLNPNGEGVIVLSAANEEDEANMIVSEIRNLIEAKGYIHKDIAVLYRANCQSRPIEEAFSKHRIPYHIEHGLNFYKRNEIRILLDYMRLMENPQSDEGDDALKAVLNKPVRYIGKGFLTQMEAWASQKNIHLYEALKTMRIDIPYIRRYVREFISIIDPLIKDAKQIEPVEMIGILREALDYDRFITDDDIPSPDDEKISNINSFQLSANKFSNIKSLINHADSFQDELSNCSRGISLLTIHKGKGLEFPIIFVTGLMEGMLPHKDGNISEERRVCFVAVSRAMKLLYLSHSHSYMGRQMKSSRFLDEMLGKC